MKPVILLLAWGIKGATRSHSLPSLKATPVPTSFSESQSVATGQQQKATESKRLHLNVKRLYQLNPGGQFVEIQPSRSIVPKTV